jgi:hypothetical protein
MTYGEFLKGYIGKKGRLEWRSGSWELWAPGLGDDILGEVYEDFVIVSRGDSRRAIPLSIFILYSTV